MKKTHSLIETEKRIMRLFKVNTVREIPEVNPGTMKHYLGHLSRSLTFPIRGSFSRETGPLQSERIRIVVKRLVPNDDDFYGVLVEGRAGRKKAVIALAEFDVDDENGADHQLIEDYKCWFWDYR